MISEKISQLINAQNIALNEQISGSEPLPDFFTWLAKKVIIVALEDTKRHFEINFDLVEKLLTRNKIENAELIEDSIGKSSITLNGIIFKKEYKKTNYIKILKLFSLITFNYCRFEDESVNGFLNNIFTCCYFNTTIRLQSIEQNIPHFSYCTFNEDIESIGVHTYKKQYLLKVFKNCNFNETVKFEHSEIYKELFESDAIILRRFISTQKIYPTIYFKKVDNKFNHIYLSDITIRHSQINRLIIKNSVIHTKLKINHSKVNSLHILETKFESKLEIKHSSVKNMKFIDSNIAKVFDASGSSMEKGYFYKSIFGDFAAFEEMKFGLKGCAQKEYQTRFVHTTFMSFSSFRGSKFFSGLDFEKTSRKELPNFLHADVNQENTNRETFRIIKHSFDFVGNKIEANRFFAQEMITYKKELFNNSNNLILFGFKVPANKDLWVVQLNEWISDFGNNYLRPICILCIFIYLYTVLSFNLNIPLNFSVIDYTLFTTGLLFIFSKISIRITEFDVKVYFFLFIFYIWYFTTIFFLDNSPLYISEFIIYLLNSMVKNLTILKIFKDEKTFIDLIYFLICSVLIWQTIVSIKRKVQR